jgi:hypothetical protein
MKYPNLIMLTAICAVGLAGSAHAAHDDGPNPRDMQRVRTLAIELDRQANDWLDTLNRRHRFPPSHSHSILGNAIRFRSAAHDFRTVVERNMRQPRRTVASFESLHDAHRLLVGRWNTSHFGSRGDQHARRIESLMRDLGRYYPDAGYSRVDWNRVRTISRDANNLADRVYSQARRELGGSSRHGDWWHRDTLKRLEDLQSAARHFRRQADTSRPDYQRVRSEYERLSEAYRYASTRSSALKPGTRHDFQRIGLLLDELGRAFDPYRGPRWVTDLPLGFPPASRTPGPGLVIRPR